MNYITCPHCGETYRNITAVHVCSSGPYAVKLLSDTNTNTKERIKQLAEHAAGEFTQTFHWEHLSQTDKDILKRFAELIVRECIDLAYKEGDNVAYLSLHFGVTE